MIKGPRLGRLARLGSLARLAPLAAIAAIAACTSAPAAEPSEALSASHAALATGFPSCIMPVVRGGNAPSHPPKDTRAKVAANNLLVYHGGRVISNVKVYQVNWGAGVDAGISAALPNFYKAITNSPYFDMLSQYSTVGVAGDMGKTSSQKVGRGTFGKTITITPSIAGTSLTNTQIGNELASQIAANKLPQPDVDAAGNVNAIYMFDFPPGISITLDVATPAQSCVDFCAYHFTKVIGGKSVPYGVHPDMGASSPCAGGCGMDPGYINNAQSVHSHELIEAVTDMEIGLMAPGAPSYQFPAAWGSASQGEIGDICNGQQDMIAGYVVQTEWSNADGACVAQSAVLPPVTVCTAPNVPVGCRPCTAADNGSGCSGATPVCETGAANVKAGFCVACTDATTCSSATPICNKSSSAATDDTCRGCTAADCTGSTPICSMAGASTGTCVVCAANKDCSGKTPVCDATTSTCTACKKNTDCAMGVCATGAADPSLGACVQCQATTDCTAPSVCDATKDTCVACVTNATCSNPKPVCNAATETCGACAKDADCTGNANGTVCETQGALTGGCVVCSSGNTAACTGATPACDDGTGTCVQCAKDTDCTTAQDPSCNTVTHTCGPAQAQVDAGVGDDAGGTGTDGGIKPGTDGGSTAHRDAGVVADGGSTDTDAGDVTTTTVSGCAMSPSGTNASGAGGLAGLFLAIGLVLRKRTTRA